MVSRTGTHSARNGKRSSLAQDNSVFCSIALSIRAVIASAAGILAPLGMRRITRRVCLSRARCRARSVSSSGMSGIDSVALVSGRSEWLFDTVPGLASDCSVIWVQSLRPTHAGHHQRGRASASVRLMWAHVRCQCRPQESHLICRFLLFTVPQ